METNFKEFKEEILKRAKQADACKSEYGKALKSETFEELITVIKNNFVFAVDNKVIDSSLIELYKTEFNTNQVWCNESCSTGYLLADNGEIEINGNVLAIGRENCTITGWENCTITGWGNCTITGWGNCTITGRENCTITGRENCYVLSYYVLECKIHDNAIYRIKESNTIRYASNSINFEKITE